MKSYHSIIVKCCMVLTALLAFSSCREKAKIQELKDLSRDISELEKELKILKFEAGQDPGDQSKLLMQADRSLERLSAEKSELIEQYRQRQESYAALEKKFLSYQENYPIENKNPQTNPPGK